MFGLDFVMLRAGVLHAPDCSLSRVELDSLLAFIGTRSGGWFFILYYMYDVT